MHTIISDYKETSVERVSESESVESKHTTIEEKRLKLALDLRRL